MGGARIPVALSDMESSGGRGRLLPCRDGPVWPSSRVKAHLQRICQPGPGCHSQSITVARSRTRRCCATWRSAQSWHRQGRPRWPSPIRAGQPAVRIPPRPVGRTGRSCRRGLIRDQKKPRPRGARPWRSLTHSLTHSLTKASDRRYIPPLPPPPPPPPGMGWPGCSGPIR